MKRFLKWATTPNLTFIDLIMLFLATLMSFGFGVVYLVVGLILSIMLQNHLHKGDKP